MRNVLLEENFNLKFCKLNKQNQRYILAIQQALLYAQEVEFEEKKKQKERKGQKTERYEL